jgi:DNA-binding transcriptional LysR family regulator
MFLRQFHYLVMLEKEEHFGRAAHRCNVSQPSLSSAVKQLELELGIPIVLRHQRFQGFTEEGRRVIAWAKRILSDRDAMVEELAIMHHDLHGRLCVAAMPMSSPVLPIISKLILNEHPSVQIEFRFQGLEPMKVGLANFEFDVGITYLGDEPLERLQSSPLYEEHLLLLVPETGWLEGKTATTWAEAVDLPLCLMPQSMRERQIVDQAFAVHDCVPHPMVETESIINLAFHVMKGEVATIIPSNFAHVIGAFPGTRQILMEQPSVSLEVGLVWVEGNPMLPMTKTIVDIMAEATKSGELDRQLKVNEGVVT